MFNLFLANSYPGLAILHALFLDLGICFLLSSVISTLFIILIFVTTPIPIFLVIPVSYFFIYFTLMFVVSLVFVMSYIALNNFRETLINGVCATAQLSAFWFWRSETHIRRLYALTPFLLCFLINMFYLFGGETPEFAFLVGIVFLVLFLFFLPQELAMVLVTLLHAIHPHLAAWASHLAFFTYSYFMLACLTGQSQTRPLIINCFLFGAISLLRDFLFHNTDSSAFAHLSLLAGGAFIVFIYLWKHDPKKLYLGLFCLCCSSTPTAYLLATEKTVFVCGVPVGLCIFLCCVIGSVFVFKVLERILPEAPREQLLLVPLLAILCGFPDLGPFERWISGFGVVMLLLNQVIMFEQSIAGFTRLKKRERLLKCKVRNLHILLLLIY